MSDVEGIEKLADVTVRAIEEMLRKAPEGVVIEAVMVARVKNNDDLETVFVTPTLGRDYTETIGLLETAKLDMYMSQDRGEPA